MADEPPAACSLDECAAEARRSLARLRAKRPLGAEYDRLTAIPVDPHTARGIAAWVARVAADPAQPAKVRNAAKGAIRNTHPIVAMLVIEAASDFAGCTTPRPAPTRASAVGAGHAASHASRRPRARASHARRPGHRRTTATRGSPSSDDGGGPGEPPGARSAYAIGGAS